MRRFPNAQAPTAARKPHEGSGRNPIWRILRRAGVRKAHRHEISDFGQQSALSSRVLHQQAVGAVGGGPDGKGALMFNVGADVGETSLRLPSNFQPL